MTSPPEPSGAVPGGRPCPGPPAPPRDAGFTLIELLVVVAILGFTALLVVGNGPPRSATLDLRAAASQVAQGLRTARAQAIAGNRETLFTLDVATGGYRIGAASVRRLPAGLALSMTAVADHTAAGRLAAIGFLPDGSSTGGRVGIAAGERVVWVAVDWLTGRVSSADAR